MPNIPTFDQQLIAPQVQAPPRADPAAFAQTGQALAQGGAQVSANAQDWANRYADAKRQSDAANISAAASAKLGDAQFRWSKTPDNQAAYDGFQQEAGQIRTDALAQSSDPLVQNYVTRQIDQESIMRGLDTRNTAFGLESSARRGDLDTRLFQYAQSAATSPNDLQRAHYVDQAAADISGSVAAGWLHPEEGAQRRLQFTSQVAEVQARSDLTNDPATALQRLSDPTAYPGLNEEARARLTDRADRRYEVVVRRGIAEQEHSDRMADHDLTRQQGQNFAGVVADVVGGKQVDVGQVAEMARTGQISGSQLDSVMSQIRSGSQGRDTPAVVVDLHRRLNDGSLTDDDVSTAMSQGQIRGQTAVDLTKALGEASNRQQTAVEKGSYATLKTALNGNAVEQGLFKDNAPLVDKWADAQSEWTKRVTVGREDPQAVLPDMLGRYATPAQVPAAWPRPRMGAVNSSDDVLKVAQATKAALDGGQISQGQFNQEAQLLTKYDAFFAGQAQASAARSSVAPTKKGGGTPVGLTPGSNP